MSVHPLQVSVIVTVYNEGESIRRLLDSLAAQSHMPDEVVICDGGSTDSTVAVIHAYRARLPNLRVLVEPGANISRGRNVAIAAAAGPIIAATDAGVRLAPDWLERLVAPWLEAERRRDGGAEGRAAAPSHSHTVASPLAVAGFFLPDVSGTFQTAMAATVLPLRQDVDPDRFLPSSRSVAFLKTAWNAAGGYPEWLDYCEDLLFDFALNAQCPDRPTAFAWAPQAVAYFRPRASLRAFWRQYYRYARGDGKADLWRRRHAVRYATYLAALPVLLALALGQGSRLSTVGWLGLLIGIAAYCARPWQRLRYLGQGLDRGEWLRAALWVPVIRAVGDAAKMVGYPVGLWWRWRSRQRPEVHWWGQGRRKIGKRPCPY